MDTRCHSEPGLLGLALHIYTYIYICVCVCVCVHPYEYFKLPEKKIVFRWNTNSLYIKETEFSTQHSQEITITKYLDI